MTASRELRVGERQRVTDIVILTAQPFDRRNEERFGISAFRARGFRVHVIDLTAVIEPSLQPRTALVDAAYVTRVSTMADMERLVSSLGPHTFALTLIEYTPATLPVYEALTRSGARYAVAECNVIPITAGNFGNFRSLLRRAGRVVKQPRRVLAKARAAAAKRASLIKLPTLLLAGGRRSILQSAYPRDESTRVVWLHQLDYDLYLRERDAEGGAMEQRLVVFLDQCVPDHPDYENWYSPPPAAEPYYAAMRRLFDHLEQMGLRVVIAAHPRSGAAPRRAEYGGREIVDGRTINLVKRAEIVVAHWTTAINFAVLFDKPIVFITTDNLLGREEGAYIETMSSWFGRQPINADRDLDHVNWSQAFSVDPRRWREYMEAFIKAPGTPERPFWEIVADEVACL